MDKTKLKELVKAHFGLVDHVPTPEPVKETFGEAYDENKAFKFVFPGDKPAVGDDVKVVTEEGQETQAPNGEHRLEDGTMIKIEDGKITEIEAKEDLGSVESDVEMVEEEFAADPAKSQVEGTAPENATTVTNPNPEKMSETVKEEIMAKVKMAIEEAIAGEIAGIKEEMKSLKSKFEGFAAEPATEKVTVSSAKKENFTSESLKDKQMKVMSELMKNKNK